ncbi:PRD domain-containing protein [Schleiferilactobacillus perolens]|uniref:Beta-glucoside bgl operon transcription antiterminator n=1 Tax=Schleiferilactobacillus perolens DSM 12744 TaxID=1423792 RepID=A0A0R1N954_9LACO|nr:PRD domain-containing protein [Schleiferilactobacillus perolens]KRL14389.1 beta-glucoside bgl operon transcription antiterminator [Schleiferilactobacillus perolens DSM 12744]
MSAVALTIKKVLNSSVVLARENDGQELIVLGKGIGYGKKSGATIEKDAVNRWFVPVHSDQLDQLTALLKDMPPDVIEVTKQIVALAHQQLGPLNDALSFTLMDHINFALERYRSGIHLQNKLYWEVQSYYPKEFAIGQQAVTLIDQQFEVEMPKEEAANIAFHLVNAAKNEESDFDSMKVTTLIDDVISLIRYQSMQKLPVNSISYQRLITHVKFFAERVLTNQQLVSTDPVMDAHVRNKYPRAARMVTQIGRFLERKYHSVMTDEEFTFLVIHIQRNLSDGGIGKGD